MGKTKNKNRSEVEYLRGELKRLRRQVKTLQKQAHFYEDVVEEASEQVEAKNICELCGKGTILTHDFNVVKVAKCSVCDYKKVIRNK